MNILRKISILLFFAISSCYSIDNKINSELKKLEFQHYQELITDLEEFINNLDNKQKEDLFLSFDNSYRISNLCYVLAHCKKVDGLKIGNLDGWQKRYLYQLLMTAYDSLGYYQIVDIINRELILEEMELASRRSPIRYKAKGGANNKKWQPPLQRAHNFYNIAIFGDIKNDDIWALRFEGHHLLLNLTFKKKDGKIFVSSTPTFMGASPAVITKSPENLDKYYPRWSKEQGQQLLYQDSILAKRIIKSINSKDRNRAKWQQIPDATLAGGTKTYPDYQEFAQGKLPYIKYRDLSLESQLYIKEFLDKIFSRQRKDFLDLEDFYKTFKDIKIAFAGNWRRDEEFYIRIQSSRFLFELLQTSNYSVKSEIKANHIHSVLRDLKSDFDFDILQKHLDHYH